jgi:hypothetical protein
MGNILLKFFSYFAFDILQNNVLFLLIQTIIPRHIKHQKVCVLVMSKQCVLQQYVGSMSVLILLLCVKLFIRLFILVKLCFQDENRCCFVKNVTIKFGCSVISCKKRQIDNLYEDISSTLHKYVIYMCRNSSGAIATRYGLDGLGIKFRWGRDFPHPSRPALGPNQTSI